MFPYRISLCLLLITSLYIGVQKANASVTDQTETSHYCGDGFLDQGEACDSGLYNGDGSSVCTINCTENICGDGYLYGEACDDGNTTNEDGCSSACSAEVCGDNIVQAGLGEQCDDGNTMDSDGCSANCQTESEAITANCGDGILTEPDEQCDDGNNMDGDGCSATCTVE